MSQEEDKLHPLRLLAVLFVADFFHPIHGLAIELFLNGNVSHRGNRGGAVPVLLAGRKPDDVARPNFFNRSSPALHPTKAGCDDEGLAQRVGVPGGSSAGLERNDRAGNTRWIGCLEWRVNAHCASEPIGRAFAGGL